MKVKDAWYFNYTQKESEILQPDMAVPESHVGIYCEFEELVFPISFHILGMCKERLYLIRTSRLSATGTMQILVCAKADTGQCLRSVKIRIVSRICYGSSMKREVNQKLLKRNVNTIHFRDRYRILTESLFRRW